MSATKKTAALKRQPIDPHLIDVNEANPNRMGNREFDLLVDNIEKVGITEAIVVVPIENGRYRVVSGHHRLEAAKHLGFETVPTTIIDDPDFDREAEDMQLLRHNTIHGRMDPNKFVQLYGKYAGKYGDEVLGEMMGFADEAELEKLIKQTAQSLPNELKKKFEQAAKEIKTVEGLAKVLNTLFTKYGNTVPYAYMVFDHGGQQNVWVRTTKKTMDAFELISDMCINESVTVDDLVGGVLQLIAKGELADVTDELIKDAPKVEIPENLQVAPTYDNIAKVASLG